MEFETKREGFVVPKILYLLFVLGSFTAPFAKPTAASASGSLQYYKMISTVEFSGKGQYRNAVETLLAVKKEILSDNQVRYSLSARDYDISGSGASVPGVISFVVDPQTKKITDGDKDLVLFEKIANQCVNALKETPVKNIGKTWSQSFSLPFLGKSFPRELKFTLTAIQLKNKELGEMIAVRALSEPFAVKTMKADGKTGSISSRINSIYLFDSQISEVYLSASVFAGSTDINGSKESLRHEIAAYISNQDGKPLITTNLGKDFEKLIRKVGLTSKALAIKKKSSLPNWACFEGLRTSQVANICASIACEGGLNPVSTIYMPVVRTISLQSSGSLASIGDATTVGSSLGSMSALGGMKVAVAPAIAAGAGLGTTGTIAAVGAGVGIAAGGGGGGGGSDRSPSTP